MPKHLELLVCDMNGVPRGKTIDPSSVESGELPHLAAAIFFQTLTGNYAGAMGRYDASDEDLLLEFDAETCRPTPWKGEEYGQVVCETLDKQGQPVAFDPRNVLRRVLDRYAEQDLHPVVAPEVEFYLVRPPQAGETALTPASGVDGRTESTGEAFSSDALDKYADFLRDVREMSEQMEISLSALVHEMGPAQIELNVGHGDALSRADQLFLLKRLVRGCAVRHGFTATFMAKPLQDLPGSGMHLHTSVTDSKGRNLFALSNGRIPDALGHFIGGLQRYTPTAFALLAPSINSFKRFVPDLSAPINLAWGYDNRTTGFRVPYGDERNGRVENRIAGADANPYLLIAASLACGWLGMQEGLEPGAPFSGDAYELKSDLPTDLHSALRSLESSKELKEILGAPFVETFVSVKRNELAHFSEQITPWEIRFLGSLL